MSEITKLVYATSIDSTGWLKGLDEGQKGLEAFHGQAVGKLENISIGAPKMDLGKSIGGSVAGSMSAAFLPAGAVLVGVMSSALGTLTKTVKDIGKTISKQLHDSFRLTQVKDDFESTEKVMRHFRAEGKADFEALSKAAGGSLTPALTKMKSQLVDMEYELRKHLQHASASFKKGGLPTFDNFFTQQSNTYKAGKKGGGGGGITSKLNPFKSAEKEVDAGSSSLLRLGVAGAALGTALAVGAAGFGFISKGIKSASDLNETLSKTDVILGSSSGKVKAFADEMATKFGLVKGETLDIASSFGGLGKSLGRISGDKLASFSTDFTKLAADLSSFSNIGVADAASAIQTGLAGNQSDKLKELGVILTEDTVKQYAYANGIAKAGQELSEQQKFTARAALITQGLSKASGDLERTQGGAANQTRKLVGTVTNLGTSIGTALLPVVTEGLLLLNEFGTWATKVFNENKATIESWTNAALDGFDWFIATVHNLPVAFRVAGLKVVEVITNIQEWIGVLGPNVVIVASYIATNWSRLIYDGFNASLTIVKNFGANITAVGTALGQFWAGEGFHPEFVGLTNGFKATVDQFPGLLKPVLTDMSKEMAETGKPILDEVNGRKANRLKATVAPKLGDAGPGAEEAKKDKKKKSGSNKDKEGGEVKFAGALELGSKEAYSAIVAAGARPSTTMEESARSTAANTAELVKILGGPRRKAQGHGGKKALVINA